MKNQNSQIEKLVARIKSLEALVKSQAAEIADLKSRLNKNSRNSSRPPSSDGLSKPPSKNDKNNASLRPKGKNKTGGQNGHLGSTLSPHNKPDKVIRHDLMVCPNCAGDLSNVAHDATQSRQVFDIPGRVEQWRGDQITRIPQLIPFPSPATSNAACGFPALRFPGNFISKLMRPIDRRTLSVLGNILSYSPNRDLTSDKTISYSISPSRSLSVGAHALSVASVSFLPNL